MNRRLWASIAAMTVITTPCRAMTLTEFLKFTSEERGTYVGAAVSMLAHTYAANGNVTKARCIRTWYFGDRNKPSVEAPGVNAIVTTVSVAKARDADRYHIEGIILGAADKACGADPPPPATKP